MSKRPKSPLKPKAVSSEEAAAGSQRTIVRWLAALTVLVVGSWVAVVVLIANNGKTDEVPGASTTEQPSSESATADPRPWGQLEVVPIVLSPPEELLPQIALPRDQGVTWYFPNTSRAKFRELLADYGMPEELRLALVSKAELDASIDGMAVRPAQQTILDLTPKVRARLYIALEGCSKNADQRRAFCFCAESPEAWLANAPLLPETKDLVLPRIYRHGRCLFFADLRTIGPMLASPEEQRRLIRVLSRDATLLVRLKLTPESDLERLVAYWGHGGRAKDVQPLLESLMELKGGTDVDVTLLLPPFARRRIYTYSTPNIDLTGEGDCLWTSVNFFNGEDSGQLVEQGKSAQYLEQHFYRITGNLELGDVILCLGTGGRFVHSAVYVADDIVFTKNGKAAARPWMLMRLDDMLDSYPSPEPLGVLYFRRKGV